MLSTRSNVDQQFVDAGEQPATEGVEAGEKVKKVNIDSKEDREGKEIY